AVTLASIAKKKIVVLIIFCFYLVLFFLQPLEIVLYTYPQTQTTFIKQPPAAIFFSLPLFTISTIVCGIFSKKKT
ncbi:MAG: hypothetical protein LBB31_02640, partial [Prevotellaceae bacterium]|nr:hypothetical protein [Prevotellaceae bacterium]